MPRGDKTGPEGNGPKTGMGMGNCEDNNYSGRTIGNFGFGRGRGGGAYSNTGMGRGYRNRGYDSFSENQRGLFSFLRDEILNLKNQISDLNKRLSD
ncbi:MAG: hypothetical protein B6I20_08865 [Bacteroidetes bacterium 4572_117]|nr:MAG: hypothetical protein B6I20_08865 [Bacteroidetes bacterium 4572_117]